MLSDIVHPLLGRTPPSERRLEFIRTIRNAGTLQEKVASLADAYKGQDAWVIAPGSSAAIVAPETLREALKDKCVIAVKRALPLVDDIATFHLLNYDHFEEPNYGPIPPLSLAIGINDFHWDRRWDMTFRQSPDVPNASLWIRSVCGSKDFARWEFSKNIDRPPGPGIMDELGFYLPVHLGCSRIFTMGFDLERGKQSYFDGAPCPPAEVDADIVVSATEARLAWLNSRGVSWYRIASDVDSRIQSPTISFHKALQCQ